ncbi:MAG: FAD-dependent oxidoreductase, partial [Pseudomonadota bacterium]
ADSKGFAGSALADVTFAPFWLDRGDIGAPEAPLNGRTDADLLVVGGGFTGLWAAILAKETNPGRDVVLIEAETVASGASGRPGGIISTSIMHGLANAKRIFPDDLERLEAFGRENLGGFREALDRYGIDCDAEWNGEMTVAIGADGIPLLDEEEVLHRHYGHDVVRLDGAAVRAEINSPLFDAGLWSRRDSGTVHPGKLAFGLKRAALSLGVRLFEKTPLIRIDEEGVTLKVDTGGGEIRPKRILLATNAFAAGHPHIRRRVAMIRDRILMTEPLSEEQLGRVGWHHRQGVYDTRTQLNYMRLTADDRILFGGRLGVFMNAPRDPSHDRTHAPYEGLASAFQKTFPQLDDVRFTHAWSGPIALTTRMAVHFQRYFGGRVVYAGGYSGFGVAASRFGADIGLAILDGSKRPETEMGFATTMPRMIPPEPFRQLGAAITMYALDTADEKGGWRRRWLNMVERMGFPLS